MMRALKLKVCGLRERSNVEAIADLHPDYIGFIFTPRSPRFVGERGLSQDLLASLHPHTKAVGVFLDQGLDEVCAAAETYGLDAVQLHGSESAEYCAALRQNMRSLEIIKAFSVSDSFPFSLTNPYLDQATYFLFDSKGAQGGGTGIRFDWRMLSGYLGNLRYFISGGIGPEAVGPIRSLAAADPRLYGVDINSRFEISPAIKSPAQVAQFMEELKE